MLLPIHMARLVGDGTLGVPVPALAMLLKKQWNEARIRNQLLAEFVGITVTGSMLRIHQPTCSNCLQCKQSLKHAWPCRRHGWRCQTTIHAPSEKDIRGKKTAFTTYLICSSFRKQWMKTCPSGLWLHSERC